MDDSVQIRSIESLPSYFSDSFHIDKISSDKLEEIGSKCRERLEQLRMIRADSGWDADKESDFNSYHLIPKNKKLPYAGYPNLACPLTRIGVDTFHANVLFTFGGQEGQFSVLPDFLSRSHMDSAERAAKYMTYVLNYESDMYDALDKADMDAEKYGIAYLEPQYVTKEAWETRIVEIVETVPDINEETGEVTPKEVKRKKKERIKKTVFDGIKVNRVAPECIFVSPFYETVEQATSQDYLFKVSAHSMRFVEEMAKGGDDTPAFFKKSQVDKLKATKCTEIASRLERVKQTYDGFMVDRMIEQEPIELAQAHFRTDINGDGLAEDVTAVFEAATGIVLRITYGKCRIVKLCPRPVDGRWYGESIRKTTQPLLTEWEAIHNQRVAKGQWSNLPFFFYKAGGRFNPQVITLMPGKGYPVDDTTAVNFPQVPSPDMSYFNEEKMILDYFDRVLALGDVIQGVNSKSGDTATGVIHSQQRAGIRLATPMNRIGQALNDLVGHIWELNKQCAPESKEFKVVGMGNGAAIFDKITGRDYEAMVSFKLNMATMYDVQTLRDTALLNYRTFISNPLVMNHPAAFYELTKNTMKAVGLEVNIPKPEQANVKSPFLEHDLIRQGKLVEPVLGEDTQEHMMTHMSFMKSNEFKDWPKEAQDALMLHYDKTQIQEETLRSGSLNQSGIFEAPPGLTPPPSTPAFTANKNPTQQFNTMKIGESGKSQQQNVKNGMTGAQNANPLA